MLRRVPAVVLLCRQHLNPARLVTCLDQRLSFVFGVMCVLGR